MRNANELSIDELINYSSMAAIKDCLATFCGSFPHELATWKEKGTSENRFGSRKNKVPSKLLVDSFIHYFAGNYCSIDHAKQIMNKPASHRNRAKFLCRHLVLRLPDLEISDHHSTRSTNHMRMWVVLTFCFVSAECKQSRGRQQLRPNYEYQR